MRGKGKERHLPRPCRNSGNPLVKPARTQKLRLKCSSPSDDAFRETTIMRGEQMTREGSCLTLPGLVRLSDVEQLLEQSRELLAAGGDVELDLAETEHLHAAALQVLLSLEKSLAVCGRALRVSRTSSGARESLLLGGLSRWLPAPIPGASGSL